MTTRVLLDLENCILWIIEKDLGKLWSNISTMLKRTWSMI